MAEDKDKKPLRTKFSKEELLYNDEIVNSIKEQNDLLSEQAGIRKESKTLSEAVLSDLKENMELGGAVVRNEEDLAKKIVAGRTRERDLIYEVNAAQRAGDDYSAKILSERLGDQRNLNIGYDEELDQREIINAKMGVMDNLMKAMEDIPFLKQFYDGEEAIAHMEESLIAGESAGKGLMNYIGTLVPDLAKMAKAAIEFTQFKSTATFLKNAMFEVSKSTAGFSRDLGLSSDNAIIMRAGMSQVAMDTGNMAITTLKTSAAMATLNDQFGTASGIIKGDIVGEIAVLTNLTNMSAESAGRFASTMMKSGKAASTVTEEARQTVRATADEFGVRLDINKTLDEAGKVTGVMAANMGNNVVAITKAISVAKQFGMTMQDLASSSSSLLDFQSSIDAELQAELFTGKQLNLEKARLAALTGDYETLTREIAANVADENEWSTMNVLAKEKMAAALGMTSDQMSDIIYKESNLAEMAKAAEERGDYGAAQDLTKRDIQQKMADLQEKMADVATTYLAPALNVVSEIFSTLADNSGLLYTMLGAITLLKFGGMVSGLLSLGASLAAAGVGSAALMSGLTLGIGAVAIVAGIVAITTAMSNAKKKAASEMKDGIIGSDGGMIVSGPKGSIQLDSEDQIIAGTNLGGGGGKGESNAREERYQKESIALLKQISVATAASGLGSMVATIAYNGFDAIKAPTHYGTKFR